MVQEKNLVSVIIPTTPKELHMAEDVRKSVLNSTYKNTEVLIINEGLERSEQRNLGILKARGEFILYLDSDQSVSRQLIEECVSLCTLMAVWPNYDALYIPEEITTKGWFAYLRNFERSFYDATPVDCVRFIRKNRCPLFSTELKGPEDADHSRRVKGIRGLTKNCIYHNDRIGFFEYFRKKNYYAKSMTRYKELNPNDKVLDWKYRCFGIFVENGKWKKIFRHPILFAGIMLVVAIRAFIYIKNK